MTLDNRITLTLTQKEYRCLRELVDIMEDEFNEPNWEMFMLNTIRDGHVFYHGNAEVVLDVVEDKEKNKR